MLIKINISFDVISSNNSSSDVITNIAFNLRALYADNENKEVRI